MSAARFLMRVLPRTAMVVLVAALPPAATAFAKTPPAPEPPAEYPEPPTEFSPAVEAENFSITEQRQAIYDTPEYQAQLTEQGNTNTSKPSPNRRRTRNGSSPTTSAGTAATAVPGMCACTTGKRTTTESSATCCSPPAAAPPCRGASGPTRQGPAKRPGVVITDGSVQADEQMYWYAAQALAKDGYVVMTFDPQGQGRSDTLGRVPTKTKASPPRPTDVPSTTAPRTR